MKSYLDCQKHLYYTHSPGSECILPSLGFAGSYDSAYRPRAAENAILQTCRFLDSVQRAAASADVRSSFPTPNAIYRQLCKSFPKSQIYSRLSKVTGSLGSARWLVFRLEH
jgi:hypothetical protein